jgi:ubiquinone/menaquinone biosynthesis C-methylase UbiE
MASPSAQQTDILPDLQHHLHRLTLDERLYLAPIKQDVQNVLDVGTGTGLWAIEFGAC